MKDSNIARFCIPFLMAISAIAMGTALSPAHAQASDDSQTRIVALESRVATLEALLAGDGELTVDRLNVRQIAARNEGYDPDYPALTITDALDRAVVGINGASFEDPKLGFYGSEPIPKHRYPTNSPTAIDVAHAVGASGLAESPVQPYPYP